MSSEIRRDGSLDYASPMKALPGSLDFYERQIALNDINAQMSIKTCRVMMVYITFDSEDEDDYDNDNLNRSASRPRPGQSLQKNRQVQYGHVSAC